MFKGRLGSGHDVAVKILKKGKANGQDSEMATVGRIHHVNEVGLIGFCFEGSKQAPMYDFMHNLWISIVSHEDKGLLLVARKCTRLLLEWLERLSIFIENAMNLVYMAPELVYKNLGGISYKTDVYNFGKLLMEMANGKKNADAVAEYSNHIYFPL
ncbi:rust resistance kinase Lr10 [Eucalyptus grandis]|uniref:rust resistance kinase Lr10 n=1 Tax=Eucalyptus grandis TaxID=71139 RepID=UPI00192EA7E9|nr:rust resistance kinase Lr10 [Eucalyptus grandis]